MPKDRKPEERRSAHLVLQEFGDAVTVAKEEGLSRSELIYEVNYIFDNVEEPETE